MGRPLPLAGAALVAALLVGLPGAFARPAAEPGITETEILLGGTVSLTGPSSAAARVARGAGAYVRWVNARGGVHGRKLVLRVLDDASDPVQSAELTRQLVEEDGVFALFGSAGTEQSLAVRGYLNRLGVPQLFVASGATALGRDHRRFPWTIGFGPSHDAEGRIYGRYLARTRPRARIAVLLQDDVDGRELLAGLRRGLGRAGASVVAAERTGPGAPDLAAQLASLEAAGADVLAVFVPPSVARRVFAASASLAWQPLMILGSAAAAAPRPPQGAVSLAFVKDPADPRWADDPGMGLARTVLGRHAKGAGAHDLLHVHGLAAAHTLVTVLRAAGPEPTRAGVLARVRRLRDASNPFLLPGIVVRTGPGDGFPLEQGVLRRRSGGSWRLFGGLWR